MLGHGGVGGNVSPGHCRKDGCCKWTPGSRDERGGGEERPGRVGPAKTEPESGCRLLSSGRGGRDCLPPQPRADINLT